MRARSFAAYTIAGLALAALAVACGSGDAGSVFSTETTVAGGGAGTSSGSASSSSTSSAQGGGSSSGSTSVGSSSSQAASSTAASSSSMASSSSGGPPPIQVYCKDAPCADGEVCCYNLQSANLDKCGAPGSCDPAQDYITIACNDIEDCPKQECCADFDFQAQEYTGVGCFDQCSQQQLVMCEGHPEVCQGGQCTPSGKLGDGYSYCQ